MDAMHARGRGSLLYSRTYWRHQAAYMRFRMRTRRRPMRKQLMDFLRTASRVIATRQKHTIPAPKSWFFVRLLEKWPVPARALKSALNLSYGR